MGVACTLDPILLSVLPYCAFTINRPKKEPAASSVFLREKYEFVVSISVVHVNSSRGVICMLSYLCTQVVNPEIA